MLNFAAFYIKSNQMKTSFFFNCVLNTFLLWQLPSTLLFAQNNDCLTRKLVCGNANLSDNSDGPGFDDFSISANDKACLSLGENQSAWYTFRIQTGGTLNFTIVPSVASDDYDFAIWGPNVGCSTLGSPFRCNFSALPGNTGLDFTTTSVTSDEFQLPFSRFLEVNVGEVYYLLIDNYSNSNQGFALEWGGTAQLSVLNPSFAKPVAICNKVSFVNNSATCDLTATLSYLWDFGDGSPTTSNNTAVNPTHIYTNKSSYNVKLTVKVNSTNSNNGATLTYTESVNILRLPPMLAFNGLPNVYCVDASPIMLTASPVGGTFTLNGIAKSVFNPSEFAVGSEVVIQYKYSDVAGCADSITQKVKINPSVTLIKKAFDLEVCPLSSNGYALEAISTAEEQALIATNGALQYAWSNGASSRIIFLKNKNDAGNYKVTVTNTTGCPLQEVVYSIVVKCGTAFSVPSAFTPNGDGRNDVWEIFGEDISKLDLRVYNRWGELIYVARSKEDAWDGNVNGKPAPAGVYIWRASYENPLNRGVVEETTGRITLIR